MNARVAQALVRGAVKNLPVRIVFPGGERIGAGGPGSPVMRLVRPEAFFHRLGANSKIGFGEAYMAGDWTSTGLADLLTPFAGKLSTLIPGVLQRVGRRYVEARQPMEERNTLEGSRENIQRHYDLSNDLFALFLDETMSYSAAWFADGSDDLHDAQRRKIDGILDMAGVTGGQHILEIGTGWGGLAVRAARRGARVTTLTISAEQAFLAQRRLEQAGVADRVQVLLRDYREARGRYDAVVSVEMIEAVGEKYWPTYFAALDRLLKPGGRVGLQAITMPHDRMVITRNDYTWISKYIFPGGVIPSVEAIEQNLARHTDGLRIVERRTLGPDYARTLAHWRENFTARWGSVAALGFDETFRRMWEFYLAYCEAGFRVGYLDVHQLSLQRR
ncbi:MAG: cyclopropane-fatty-acyl-phospholipid synthase family protein [Pseudonocardia sp.]|nr:cyclopropane-fatty-acyl-phospholipid synthase family protein [Pseudonocardia sp.]